LSTGYLLGLVDEEMAVAGEWSDSNLIKTHFRLDEWPFELFVHLANYFDAIDLLTLRLVSLPLRLLSLEPCKPHTNHLNLELQVNRQLYVYATDRAPWRVVATHLSLEGPIPITIQASLKELTHSDSSDITALVKSVVTGNRVHDNWLFDNAPPARSQRKGTRKQHTHPGPTLRRIMLFHPSAGSGGAYSISALVRPGSRYLISIQTLPGGTEQLLAISDIHAEVILGEWRYDVPGTMLTYRPVDNGAAIMFVFQRGVVNE
jgi:hypothetical protein